jgi:hypothetical protein
MIRLARVFKFQLAEKPLISEKFNYHLNDVGWQFIVSGFNALGIDMMEKKIENKQDKKESKEVSGPIGAIKKPLISERLI